MARHLAPLWIPLTAIVSAGLIIFGISRVLLSFSHEVTPFVALGIALAILLGCAFISTRLSEAGSDSSGQSSQQR
jgi:uncharacterized membrane protein